MHYEEFKKHHREEESGWALFFIFESIQNLAQQIQQLMSIISDFATKQNTFNDRIDAAIADLQGDVKNLTDQIVALQNSGGAITPEDQALLDGLQSRASGIADKLDALDALTPPTVPTPPAGT